MGSQELYGPKTAFSQWIHSERHRGPEETYDDYCVRYARAVARDTNEQYYHTLGFLRDQVILPAGRQQVSVGRPTSTTALNCFVMGTIPDSLDGIFETLKQAVKTMGMWGGVGYDFSTIRPEGSMVGGLGEMGLASGPVNFMKPFSSIGSVLDRGRGRGAQMACLSIHHPDIIKFVNAKRDQSSLTAFNISSLVTDEFMEALARDGTIELRFEGRVYSQPRAWDIWGPIMESNWDWAEPGVIFITRVNKLNPLWYCERISATNPCAEQPLPPYGCCLLSSLNMTKFLIPRLESLPRLDESHPTKEPQRLHMLTGGKSITCYSIDSNMLESAVEMSVRANDNVIDRTVYPLPQQELEEKSKRRMGVGPAGMANALEIMGYPYASDSYIVQQEALLQRMTNHAYRISAKLAQEKGSFPLFNSELYMKGEFVQRLDPEVQAECAKGLRNALLTSIAPTGTIALDADNISGGIEPVFAMEQDRVIDTVKDGWVKFQLKDYAWNFYGVRGRTANEVSPQEHIKVLCSAQKWTDSSISKTCNVYGQKRGQGPGTTFAEFEQLYLQAYEGGAKSCTTFNLNGKRMGVLQDSEQLQPVANSSTEEACAIDPTTGIRSCES